MVLVGNMGRDVHCLSTYCMLAMVLGAFQLHFTLALGIGLSESVILQGVYSKGAW